MDEPTLAQRVTRALRARRLDLRMSLQDVADATGQAGRPLALNTVWKTEHGRRRMDLDELEVLATALKVAPAELLQATRPTQ